MKKLYILLVTTISLVCSQLKAQSVGYAESLIEQGRYLDAAKVLRPLADGGDAKAQVLAANLFFDGKGVAKNDTQGVKYAKKAADQGFEEGIECLALHYYNKKDYVNFYKTTHEYVEIRHPYLKKGKAGGWLGLCYLHGWGVARNEELAWEIIEQTSFSEQIKKEFPSQWQAYMERHPELSEVHDVVEQMPSFPGGQSALFKYLSDEIIYPADCINKKIQGRVIVSFVVERDGSISNIKIVKSVHRLLDEEAIRVTKKMPKWVPGKKKGRTVRVKYTLPFTYRL